MTFRYEKCPICDKWGWLDSHKCPPIWETYTQWNDEIPEDDEWVEYRASDMEEAAEKAGESYDQDEYSLVRGGEINVLVRNPEIKEVAKYTVTAEAIPHYYANFKYRLNNKYARIG